MATEKGFSITVSSRYDGWWRYNVQMMCGAFDAADVRTGFFTASSEVAEAGSNLPGRPADIPQARSLTLTTAACDHIVLYIYIIPHTLPAGNDIDAARPFDLDIEVTYDGRKVLAERRAINQWSGASIEMRLEKK